MYYLGEYTIAREKKLLVDAFYKYQLGHIDSIIQTLYVYSDFFFFFSSMNCWEKDV